MNLGLRILVNSLVGLVIGVFAVLIAVVLVLAFAFVTGGDASLPGIIGVWATEENDAVALNFAPNFAGMGIASLALAVLYAVITTLLGQRRAARADLRHA